MFLYFLPTSSKCVSWRRRHGGGFSGDGQGLLSCNGASSNDNQHDNEGNDNEKFDQFKNKHDVRAIIKYKRYKRVAAPIGYFIQTINYCSNNIFFHYFCNSCSRLWATRRSVASSNCFPIN